NVFAKRPQPPPPPPGILLNAAAAASRDLIEWRHVVGTFQITIPVKTKEILLGPELRLLSVLRWIAERMPLTDRWYPVFKRSLEQVGGRGKDLGGDPGTIQPSPSGDGGGKPHPRPEDQDCFTGKIAGLIYDRFGDFEGFVLNTREGERKYYSREKDI